MKLCLAKGFYSLFCSAIFDRGLTQLGLQITGRPRLTIGRSLPVVTVQLCLSAIEIDAVRDALEHIAAGVSALDSDADSGGIAGGVNYGLKEKG